MGVIFAMISLVVNSQNKVALFPQGAGNMSKKDRFSKTYVRYDIDSTKSLLLTSKNVAFIIDITTDKYVQRGKFALRISR